MRQRNRGARATDAPYLLFIDSDMVLHTSVVRDCVRQMQANPECLSLIIPEVSIGWGFWAHCKALERSCYLGDGSIEAARFFERAAFDQANGYDEELTGVEDWDLSQRVGADGTICRIPAAIDHLEGRLTLAETMRTKYYYGKSMGRYLRKHLGRQVRGQIVPVRAAYIRHWRRLVADPVHLGGFVVMKAAEMAAGGLGPWWAFGHDAMPSCILQLPT